MMKPAAATLDQDLAAAGFLLLGSFSPGPEDRIPDLAHGHRAATLLLIGSTGPTLWPKLIESPEFADEAPDPLDRYTRRTLLGTALKYGFDVLFPFEGPPYHPFQQWALACGSFSRSPMGVLAHRDFGPWSGFRAVFLSREPLWENTLEDRPGPCEACEDKPCIAACPADALSSETGYDVPKCRAHLEKGRALDCWTGCLARQACPVGQNHLQAPDNAQFHMESFVGLYANLNK
ncbi:hypothetical protein FMN50_14220 [Rhodobacterales bacterium]|nr:hypothetical protein FMN50_14220 [Rhodobacterales bacterium]